jgi:hypothetical protein
MTPEDLLAGLNEMLALDPCTFRTLLEARSLVNADLKKAAEGFTYKHGEATYLRPMGLLNTILKPHGITIGVTYDPDGNPTAFKLLQSPTE